MRTCVGEHSSQQWRSRTTEGEGQCSVGGSCRLAPPLLRLMLMIIMAVVQKFNVKMDYDDLLLLISEYSNCIISFLAGFAR